MAITDARAVLHPVRLWLLPFLLGVSPVLTLVGPRATPLHVLFIGMAAAITVWAATLRQDVPADRAPIGDTARAWLTEPVFVTTGILLAIAWLSEFWSTNAGYGALTAARLTGMAVAGVFALAMLSGLESRLRDRARSALAWGGVALVALYVANTATGGVLVIEARHLLLDHPVTRPESLRLPTRSSAILATVLWPFALVVARRIDWRLACALVVMLAPCVLAQDMRAVSLAFFVGVIGWGVARWGHRRIPAVAGIALAVAIFVLPPALSGPTPRAMIGNASADISQVSVAHRLKIWEFTLSKIDERPWLGWGLAASRELATKVDPTIQEPWGPGINLLPLHPHNNALQVWVELGVLGALAFAALCAAVGWKISRLGQDPSWRACAFATFASYMTIGGLSYGAAQTWWVATAWLAALFLAVGYRPSNSSG